MLFLLSFRLMVIAVQTLGLVMALLIVKIRPMAVTLHVMIMMVVTVKVAVEPLAVAVKTVTTVNMILLHMDLSAVIQHGMNMVLTVPRLNQTTIGIVQAVIAQVMVVVLMVVLMVVVNAQLVI